MAVPVLRTWTAGELVTASYMNANIRDAGLFYQATPTFQARQTATQSTANNANTTLLWDTEVIDSDNAHSTSTNTSRYVPKTPGYYMIAGGHGWVINSTGVRCCWLVFNAVAVLGSQNKLNACAGAATCLPVRTKYIGFNGTTDYVELAGFQNSGGALNSSVGSEETSDFSGHWIRT